MSKSSFLHVSLLFETDNSDCQEHSDRHGGAAQVSHECEYHCLIIPIRCLASFLLLVVYHVEKRERDTL